MAGGRGLEGFTVDLALHRKAVRSRAPVHDRILGLVADLLDGDLGPLVERAWRRRRFTVSYERPLLFLASMRLDAMRDPDHPLRQALLEGTPAYATVTRAAVAAAVDGTRTRFWETVAARYVQTNETSRAVAWLWPAHLAGAGGGRRTLDLVDIGASAGLNLVADRLPPIWTERDGHPVPVGTGLDVATRLGLDRVPLDVCDEEQADWLRACVWPGESDRLGRLDAAIAAFRAAAGAAHGPRLEALDARDVPGRLERLCADRSDTLVLAYQSIFRQYLAEDELSAYRSGMEAWLRGLPRGRAVWIELEMSDDVRNPEFPVDIVAHVATGGDVRSLLLARCGYHPSVLLPHAPGVDELVRRLSA